MHFLENLDPLAIAGVFAMLSFSFMASFHCALMCTPLVSGALCKRGGAVGLRDLLLYNCGRLFGYVGIGAMLGVFGASLLAASRELGILLALLIGVCLLMAAWRTALGKGIQGGANLALVKKMLLPLLRRAQNLPLPFSAFALGVVTVCLPCMTLTPVLALAAGSGSALKGAALLAAFQLGTVPVMIIAPRVPGSLRSFLLPQAAQKMAAFFLLIAGIVTLFRIFH